MKGRKKKLLNFNKNSKVESKVEECLVFELLQFINVNPLWGIF